MSGDNEYEVPDIWTWEEESGGTFGSINRPIAGSTFDKELHFACFHGKTKVHKLARQKSY